jgi:hypothetical protein
MQNILVVYSKGIYLFLCTNSPPETYQSSEKTVEAFQIKEPDMQDALKLGVCLLDNESTNMENDSDVFHSLESSAHTVDSVNNSVVDTENVCSESSLKKQRVGSPDKENKVISTQFDSLEEKEQITSQPTTWKTENELQNTVNDLETRAADTAEAKHVVEEQDNLEAVVQKTQEKNGKPFYAAEVDVEVVEESVSVTTAKGKHSEAWKCDANMTVCHRTTTVND